MTRSVLAMGVLSLTLAFACGTVGAANNQQQKMAACNSDAKAKGLKSDERKSFMKSCLSTASATAATNNSQQGKMKACNADASTKGLKGADRKKFMSDCLKSGAQ